MADIRLQEVEHTTSVCIRLIHNMHGCMAINSPQVNLFKLVMV